MCNNLESRTKVLRMMILHLLKTTHFCIDSSSHSALSCLWSVTLTQRLYFNKHSTDKFAYSKIDGQNYMPPPHHLQILMDVNATRAATGALGNCSQHYHHFLKFSTDKSIIKIIICCSSKCHHVQQHPPVQCFKNFKEDSHISWHCKFDPASE